ncbi:hypothetical protein D3C81_970770 [compost metagenome]
MITEYQSIDREVLEPRITARRRFRCIEESPRPWMTRQKAVQGQRIGRCGDISGNALQEDQKIFGRGHRKAVERVRHDIGDLAAGQGKPNCQTTRAGQRISVSGGGYATEVGEPQYHRHRLPLQMRSPAEGAGVRRSLECTVYQQAFGMGRTKPRMTAEGGIERIEQSVVQRLWGHRVIPCVVGRQG